MDAPAPNDRIRLNNANLWGDRGFAGVNNDYRREATGLERTAINSTLAEMHALMERMEARGIHESMMAGVVSSYEKMLDAVMYGYPAAVIDGWDEPHVERPISVRFRRMLDRVMVGRSR